MSFLSGLFGRTKYEPTSRTVQTVSKLPEEIAPYVTDILEDAQAQYDKAVAEGYQPYGQETIAPRTQEELDAMAGLRGLIGGQGKYIDEAEAALRGIDTEFTAEAAQKFMSPYQQAVTDIEKRKAQEDFQRRIMPAFEKQAVEAGGMSGLGSRAGVQAARLGEAQLQQLGDIQSKGQQKAYEDAYRQFTDQAVRQRTQAEDLRNVGLQRFQTGLTEQGLGQQLAQQDRQETQNILDKKFLEYLEQEQYPAQKLAEYSGLVYGNPLAKIANTTETTSGFRAPNAPGIGQQLLGLGLSGLNVFGMGGGFSPGGFAAQNLYSGKFKSPFGAKTGGRIVYRQEGGEVPNVYSQGQQVAASPMMGSRSGLGGFFGGIFRPRQTNVIENIDNAAGSLNDYKEAMDKNMKDLSRASQGIAQTYGQTFGQMQGPVMLRQALEQAGLIDYAQKATPTVAQMKAGGGLGSLPVVKKQQGRGVGRDIRTRSTSPMETLADYFRRTGANRRTRNLQRDMANYQGQLAGQGRGLLRDSQGKLPKLFSRQSPVVDAYIREQQKEAERMQGIVDAEGNVSGLGIGEGLARQGKFPKLFSRTGAGPTLPQLRSQISSLTRPDSAGISSYSLPDSAGLEERQRQDIARQVIEGQAGDKGLEEGLGRILVSSDTRQPRGSDYPVASGLTSIGTSGTSASGTSAPGDIRSRFKSLGFDPDKNLAKAIKTMFTSYEEGQRRSDDLIKKLEKSPKQLTKLAQDKINIEELSNKKQLAAQAEAIKARDLIDADFDKQDEDALNKYEERKMKRFEDRAKAWPGAEFAAAIDAGMDEPSMVTMLTKVMNVGVAGVSKRAEKIDNELDKFRDAMEEKQEALRGKKKTSAVNKASRKEQLASDKILKELGIDLKTADLPIQELKTYLSGLNTISQIKGRKFDKSSKMVEVLTKVFGERNTGSGVTSGKAKAGLNLIDPKEAAENLATLNIIPSGLKFNAARKGASMEAIRLIEEGKQTGQIKLTTDQRQAEKNEALFLLKPENVARLKRAAEKADPNVRFDGKTPTTTRPKDKSNALINSGVSNIANMGQSGT